MERKVGFLVWEDHACSLFPLVPQNLFSFYSITQQPGLVIDCMALITQKHPEHPLRQLWFSLIPLFAQGHKLMRNIIRVSQLNPLLLTLGSLTLRIRLLSQPVRASPGPVS